MLDSRDRAEKSRSSRQGVGDWPSGIDMRDSSEEAPQDWPAAELFATGSLVRRTGTTAARAVALAMLAQTTGLQPQCVL